MENCIYKGLLIKKRNLINKITNVLSYLEDLSLTPVYKLALKNFLVNSPQKTKNNKLFSSRFLIICTAKTLLKIYVLINTNTYNQKNKIYIPTLISF